MNSPINFATKMTDTEALMWRVDADPVLSSTFANLTVLDRRPNMDFLAKQLNRSLESFPRLAQRVLDPGSNSPTWEVIPNFDAHDHVRRIKLPRGSSFRDVCKISIALNSQPLDRTKPLWEFVSLEGLPNGQSAMVQRIHHAMADGEASVRLSMLFLDMARQSCALPAPLKVGEGDPIPEPYELHDPTAEESHTFDPMELGATITAIGAGLGGFVTKFFSDPSRLSKTAHHITHWPSELGNGVDIVRSMVGQLYSDPAHSALWTQRSLGRELQVLALPFEDAKRVATYLGGTLNDVFLTGVLGGAGRYHRAHNVFIDELRVAIPISTRTKVSGGNAFIPSRVLLPAGIEDPIAMFAEVHDRLSATKSDRALPQLDKLVGLANALPTNVLTSLAKQQTKSVDFAASNVRAAPMALYIAGAKILANHPIGPMSGTAFNITLLSYAGMLNMGLHIDTAAVPDGAFLRECISDSFDELVALV